MDVTRGRAARPRSPPQGGIQCGGAADEGADADSVTHRREDDDDDDDEEEEEEEEEEELTAEDAEDAEERRRQLANEDRPPSPFSTLPRRRRTYRG
ncbi:MAG TPA: hypothetical protein VK116_13315, partial [Planctomycetota bacterium]|nr:hypothetical protein [Planctomycetota bacterium]